MTLLDESRDHRDAFGRKIHFFQVAGFPDKENRSWDAAIELECTATGGIDNTPIPPALVFDIDHLPTRADFNAVYPSSFHRTMVDGLPVSEQPTWLIPVVHDPRRKTRPEAQALGGGDYTSTIRRLVKSSGIYALASFVSPLISLILSPFLTHHLSRTDYGALAVLNTAIALMVGVSQLGLSNAFFRAYNCDYESRSDQLRVVSTVVVLLLLASLPATVIVILAAPWLSVLLFNSPSFSDPVRIAALVVLLQNLTLPGFAWLRAENRAVLFSTLSILNLFVSLGLNIVLVGVAHMGIAGSLLAIGAGYGVVVVCTLPVVLLRAGVRLHCDIALNLLSFGLPLVSNFVSVWVLQLSDRYLLSHLGSLAQTASYAVAYSLGGIISVVVLSPFSLAWPTAMFTIAKRDDASHVFQLVFRWFSLALLFITFSFSLIGMSVLFLFFPPAYHWAAPIIPIVAVSTMFYGVYSFFTTGIGVQRKNWLAVVFTIFSALLNVGLNIILIPRYGAIGAAFSTLIAYAVLVLIAYVVNQRIYYIPYKIGIFITALSVGIALYIAGSFLARTQEIFGAYTIYVVALGIYGICLVMLGRPLMLINKYKYWRAQEDSRS